MKQNQTKSLSLQKFDKQSLNFLKIFTIISVILLNSILHIAGAQIFRKSMVDFYSSDSLLITADLYLTAEEEPYILLFHQENSSRGEFDSLAERFVKMRFNCLAVDLRVGDSYNFVNNLTAQRAKEKNLSTRLGADKDIRAAISYVQELSNKKIILLGSSLSASLVLKEAVEDSTVGAVMAFSPGEYLRPEHNLGELINALEIPAYITCSPVEYPYLIQAIEEGKEEGTLTIFAPPPGTNNRGAQLLTKDNPSHDQYWLSVLIFIKSLQF